MAFWTRSAVRTLTLSDPLMVRETVAVETLASLATSLMFIDGLWSGGARLSGVVNRARGNSNAKCGAGESGAEIPLALQGVGQFPITGELGVDKAHIDQAGIRSPTARADSSVRNSPPPQSRDSAVCTPGKAHAASAGPRSCSAES